MGVALLYFAAFILRLIFIPNPGFEADVSFWKSWGLGPFDHGIVWAVHNTNINYPTPFAYLLWFLTWIYSWFADPHAFNQFWTNTNPLFLTIFKMPSVLADLGIAGIIMWFTNWVINDSNGVAQAGGPPASARSRATSQLKKLFGIKEAVASARTSAGGKLASGPVGKAKILACILAAFYLLNPVAVIDGAWWGQVDSVGVFVFLVAIVLALKNKPFLAGFIYIAAMMTKLQNMIYGPIFFLFLWQLLGVRGLIRGIAGAVLGFFGLNIEFLLARDMSRVMASLTDNYNFFPWMSLNAYNIWWVVSGAKGMATSDRLLAVGLLNAKKVGLLLFASSYLFAILHLLYARMSFPRTRESSGKQKWIPDQVGDDKSRSLIVRRFFEALVIVAGAFFMFQTESHDRYAFPIIAFILFLVPFIIASAGDSRNRGTLIPGIKQILHNRAFQIFSVFYVLFSLFFFYNLHTALVINYPNNGLPILSSMVGPEFTIPVSFILLILFLIYLTWIVRRSSLSAWLVPMILLIGLLLLANIPLILKKPVSLTTLTPFTSEQGYGSLQTNMPVGASNGINQWSRLSDQYFFYQKGIGTHSVSTLVYDIGGLFKKFSTDYGIDTEAGERGTATFEIYGDGKKLFASEKMVRYENPKHIEVDVTGVKHLNIATTDGGDGTYDDHTDWLRPTLWP